MEKKLKLSIIFSLLLVVGIISMCGTVSAANINGSVYDAYDKSIGDYVGEYGDAVPVANATVKLKSKNNTLSTTTTGKSGTYTFKNVAKGSYTVEISYLTYKSFSKNVTVGTKSITIPKYTFVPDIAIISYYGTSGSDGQLNKMQALQRLSCRVYTIASYDKKESYRHWMLEYTNFILIDMYTQDCAVSAEDIVNSPANKKRMISYVFGIFTDEYLKKTLKDWNFVGGTSKNNTPNTLENTYIGSYWQAEVVKDDTTVEKNMRNMLDYIFYLLGETTVNPTENASKTPLLPSTFGIYHKDYGVFGATPSQKQVNAWIKANPGYNNDGSGSLNWMTKELKAWSAKYNDPDKIFKDFEKWYNTKKSKIKGSFIVIASYYPGGSLVDAMIKAYEKQGRAVLNLFQSTTDPPISELLEKLTVGGNGTKPLSRGVVCVTSLYSWSMDFNNMNNGGAIDDFTAMNIAIFKAVSSISEYSYMSDCGPQAEWTYAVTIPQFEGVFGAIPVSYIDSNGNEVPVQEGIDKVVKLTNKWAILKEKANKNKKVAIILYNYPPGKSGLGASYLDIFQSLHDLLVEMSDAGYNIGMKKKDIPSAEELYTIIAAFGNKGTWAQGLLNSYVKNNYKNLTANNQLVNLSQYTKWFKQLPEELQKELVARWGSGLGEIMVYNNQYLVIPGIVCGNVFITVQPSRGWEEVENYHDPDLPPHQQYVAFYKWIDQVFKADAMIHMGTHGTVEWLPGRSIGLQADDWTFQLCTIPDIYPYITSDPGEGMVAKDRASALVISHMTPATVSSGLYGDLVTLHNYVHSYNNAINVDASELAYEYEIKIREMAEDLGFNLPKKGQKFADWLEILHMELHDLENDIITFGLHTLGKGLIGDELIQETVTISSSRTDILENIKNLLYPSLSSVDYYTMLSKTKYEEKVEVIKGKLNQYITKLVNGTSLSDLAKQLKISSSSKLYANLKFCVETISKLKSNIEMESIMNALSGGYIIPGLAADPSYADVLPTGTSMYSLDTTKMPTEAAFNAAKRIVDKQLVEYYQKYGKFPELVTIIMWGTELLRTEGIGIAQFLYYMGVTPTWSETGDVNGIKLIKLSELTIKLDNGKVIKRPRIDVMTTAVTSNVNWLSLMVDAVKLVNSVNESTSVNYIKKHYAQHKSLDRIFGLPGAILEGTGVSDFLPNTSKWENSPDMIKDAAEIYLSRISNAWTVDENGRIVVSSNRNTFEYLLKNTDLITQNIDSTWRFLDSSDYYDWFGGALLAAQYLGNNPDTSVVDIRDKNNIITRDLAGELEFETRGMLLNPKYQDGLLNSGPSGWLEYAARIENLFAFNAINKNIYGGNLVSDSMWDQIAQTLLSSKFNVDADYKAVSFQSMAGWLITAAYKGMWNADSKVITDLANKFIKSTEYGVTCCHHTCANVNFNNYLVSKSSLNVDQLQQYAEAMFLATGMSLTVGSTGNPPQSDQNSGSSSSQSSQSSSTPGESSGSAPAQPAGSSGSKAHEITTENPGSSGSNTSTPSIAIIGVILLMCLVGVGYFRTSIMDFLKK